MHLTDKVRKDHAFRMGAMIVALTIMNAAGFIFLYYKSELDVKQTANEVGIIREVLMGKVRLENYGGNIQTEGSASDGEDYVVATSPDGGLKLLGADCIGSYSIKKPIVRDNVAEYPITFWPYETPVTSIRDQGSVTVPYGKGITVVNFEQAHSDLNCQVHPVWVGDY